MHLVHGDKYCMVYQKGSVLGPLLFNIFLIDLIYFVESTDIVNYAGDTLPYSATECVLEKLRRLSSSLFKWYSSNYVKVNGGKSHIVMSGKQMTIACVSKCRGITWNRYRFCTHF